jgi:hypothetical protein
LETQHDIYRSFVLNQDLVPEQATAVYHATELSATGVYSCPVPQCGSHSGARFNLHQHFLMKHPQDLVCIPIKGSLPLPKCTQCGLQMPVEDLGRGHHCTGLCQRGWERKCQHEAAVHSQRALECTFSANGEELERVEVFKYLGQLISHDDANNQAMRSNLRKHVGAGLGSPVCCRLKMRHLRCVGCSIRQPCRPCYFTEVRHGVCLCRA